MRPYTQANPTHTAVIVAIVALALGFIKPNWHPGTV